MPFNPNKILDQLKIVKKYTNRPVTPKEQSNPLPPTPIITPRIRIQQGTVTIDLPIDQAEKTK